MIENPQQYDKDYMPGIENKGIRYYFYLNAGLNIVNIFRNLILAILGLYIALHWNNWLLLPLMFIPSVIILTIAGYYTVHRVNKVSEWLSLRFGTHYGIKSFNYQQETVEQLKQINFKLGHEIDTTEPK